MAVPLAPPPPPARRPARGGRLVAFALGLAAVAAGASWAARGTLAERAAAAERAQLPRVTHQTVMGEIRGVARLATAEATLRDVISVEQTNRVFPGITSTKRALLVVTGRVGAGMDLGRDSARVAVDTAARRIAVALPPAELLTVEVTDVRTYDERSGLFNPWRPADRDAVQREARAQLARAGASARLLEQADRNAAGLLRALLARDGYTVDVTVRPRAGGAGAGRAL